MASLSREQLKTIKFKYTSYKKRAKARSIYFSLTLSEFTDMVTSPCNYCGVPPCSRANRYINRFGKKTSDGRQTGLTLDELDNFTVLLNGVDRFENEQPYVESNCVPCCKMCNMAKSDSTVESFLIWIFNIVDYNMEWYLDRKEDEDSR